jgi:hypothetical protein
VALHTSLTPPIDDVSMDDPPHHDVQVQSERVEDVQMEELKVETNGHANGNGNAELDQPMDVQTPATTSVPSPLPAASSSTTIDSNPVSTPYSTPNDCSHNDDARPPPAKRARMHYDNEESSLAHVSAPRFVRQYIGVLIMCQVSNSTSSASRSSQWHEPCPSN